MTPHAQQDDQNRAPMPPDPSDAILPQRLVEAGLVAQVEHHRSLPSTQLRARELARAKDCGPLPLLVVADEQTAGRGRGTNRWWTGPGSLAFSLLFDPQASSMSLVPQPGQSLAVAVAIVETVRPLLGAQTVGLHWPNDVFAGGKKLAGVLIDVLHAGRYVIGVGLNVNNTLDAAPADVRARATSLRELSGREFDRTELLQDVVRNVGRAVRHCAADAHGFAARYGEMCLQLGQVLTIDLGTRRVTGRCTGVDVDGALVLESDAGTRKFYSGVLVHGP